MYHLTKLPFILLFCILGCFHVEDEQFAFKVPSIEETSNTKLSQREKLDRRTLSKKMFVNYIDDLNILYANLKRTQEHREVFVSRLLQGMSIEGYTRYLMASVISQPPNFHLEKSNLPKEILKFFFRIKSYPRNKKEMMDKLIDNFLLLFEHFTTKENFLKWYAAFSADIANRVEFRYVYRKFITPQKHYQWARSKPADFLKAEVILKVIILVRAF